MTGTRRAVSPREAFDELLRRKVAALVEHGLSPGAPEEINQAAREDAQVFEAQATAFADAVDRTDAGTPYGDAVVITGSAGVVVVRARDYAATPIYWQSLAGEVDLIIDGADVMRALHT